MGGLGLNLGLRVDKSGRGVVTVTEEYAGAEGCEGAGEGDCVCQG